MNLHLRPSPDDQLEGPDPSPERADEQATRRQGRIAERQARAQAISDKLDAQDGVAYRGSWREIDAGSSTFTGAGTCSPATSFSSLFSVKTVAGVPGPR